MASTTIKIPGLPTGLTLTVDVLNSTTLATVQAGVACTESSGIYSGTVTAAAAGQLLFVLKASGSVLEQRLRTIADDTGTYVIATELELADKLASIITTTGTGAYTLTITVDDGTDPLENATVRLTEGANTFVGETDASGQIAFSVDAATYDVAITKAGYTFSPTTKTVSGTGSQTYSMSGSSITPPASASVSTGVMVVYDENGDPEQSVPISIQLTSGPGTDGYGYDTKARSALTDVNGYVEFTGMIRGATYSVWRGAASGTPAATQFGVRSSETRSTCTVPDAASFSLPEVTGADAES